MSPEINKVKERELNPTEQQILSIWNLVPETIKGELIAKLLNRTDGWHDFGRSEGMLISWLKAKFEDAGIPFMRYPLIPSK